MAYGGKDVRLARRGDEVLDAIVAKNSLVLRKIGGGRAGEVAAGRFLDNGDVTARAIIEVAAERTLAAGRGRRVLAIQDTTEAFPVALHDARGLDRAATTSVRGSSAIHSCWSTSSTKLCWAWHGPISGRGRKHQPVIARSGPSTPRRAVAASARPGPAR